MYIANVRWNLSVPWGPITDLTFYNDYSILDKEEASFHNSSINTSGVKVTAEPVLVFIDAILGKNMVILGGSPNALASRLANVERHLRFNVNIEYYF